jgi:hypothetical protein
MTTNIALSELKGFSRTLAELEWLLLVLVLLYYVIPTTDIIDQWSMLLAMAIYAVLVISFRYSTLFTSETPCKLAVRRYQIIAEFSRRRVIRSQQVSVMTHRGNSHTAACISVTP